jgi:hypothetical protein
MIELIALAAILVALFSKRRRTQCPWRLEGISLDGNVIEVCDRCTRVRVYMIDRDGSPLGIAEINRIEGETAGEAILRVYREQNGDDIGGDC